MADQLNFDPRLWNPYAVANLEQSHPELHAALKTWFEALKPFEASDLLKLANARGPAEVAKWGEKGKAALADAPAVASTLGPVIAELKRARAGAAASPGREQLESLLQAAEQNRAALVDHAPAFVARALGSSDSHDALKAAAVAAVEATAFRLEQMLVRSQDESRSYRDLQPLVNELKETWAALDTALRPLSRQDQREVRGPQDRRMTGAATALCLNLFLRKMRDRQSGAWPMPEITPPGDSAPERFAAALARGDYAAAHTTLAPWLTTEWTVERLSQELRQSASEIAAGFDLEEAPPPGAYDVGSNPMSYAEVRNLGDAERVPEEITAENFLRWVPIQIQTEEEDGYLTNIEYVLSLYTVAVSFDGAERIGYVKLAE
ncbi:MAG TPA: hypothetical protein VH879_13660 [Gemmatimonadales bacterium]|jgi:hypothetical protein